MTPLLGTTPPIVAVKSILIDAILIDAFEPITDRMELPSPVPGPNPSDDVTVAGCPRSTTALPLIRSSARLVPEAIG